MPVQSASIKKQNLKITNCLPFTHPRLKRNTLRSQKAFCSQRLYNIVFITYVTYFCNMPELKDFFVDMQDELYQRQTFVIDKGQEPMRIDKWLHARLFNTTRNRVQKGIEAGFVTVNSKPVKSNYRIKPGDEITVMQEVSPENGEVIPEPIPLNIIYEDNTLLVINKPSDMVVHPGVGNYTGTLLNGIAYHLQETNPELTEDELPRYGLVHRIDKNTTGLLVVAKTDVAASHLANQFYLHTTERKYLALVWGNYGRKRRHRKRTHCAPSAV